MDKTWIYYSIFPFESWIEWRSHLF